MSEDKNLSKSAKIVQEALLKKGFSLEVVELPFSTRTAKDAANTLGCEVAQIIKSLLKAISFTIRYQMITAFLLVTKYAWKLIGTEGFLLISV